MSKQGAPDPIPIGEIVSPAFVRLPDPSRLFAARAERFRFLAASGHRLSPYLAFLASLADIQHRLQDGLPAPDLPEPEAITRAREFGMPPLDRGRFASDGTLEATFDRFIALAGGLEMPEPAAAALRRVADADAREAMVRNVLDFAIPFEAMAEHAYAAAVLQVHFARLASALDERALVPVGDGACPACGSPPVSSLVVGWIGAHGARYCACSLCATLWNYVRIKCVLCASTKGIAYQEVEGFDTVKAETCENCRSYMKVLQQHRDPALDPVADDVASLALDLLLRDTRFRRGGVNPFLTGY